jgi:hypothetical protein
LSRSSTGADHLNTAGWAIYLANVLKFRELARQLETHDDEARFDERLKKLAPKPAPKDRDPAKG